VNPWTPTTPVRCLVLRGEGHSSFPAGTDISTFTVFTSGDDRQAYEDKLGAVAGRLLGVRIPTIAMIRGQAIGGLMLAAACDIRICAAGTRFRVPIARAVGNCLSQAGYNLLADSSLLTHMLSPPRDVRRRNCKRQDSSRKSPPMASWRAGPPSSAPRLRPWYR
jgi:hypothetical protein